MALYNAVEESVPSLAHFSLCVCHPAWLCLPLLPKAKTEEVKTTEKLTEQEAGDERVKADRKNETRQGRTLSQQGVMKRVKRMMLRSCIPLPISTHNYFIRL